ncbi:MAG TPA: hypothetical protein VJJ47_00730 [Candidatus Paceibacterota bacterium]
MKYSQNIARLGGYWHLFHEAGALEAAGSMAGRDLSLLELCQVVGLLGTMTSGLVAFRHEDLRSHCAMFASCLRVRLKKINDEMALVTGFALVSLPNAAESIDALERALHDLDRRRIWFDEPRRLLAQRRVATAH